MKYDVRCPHCGETAVVEKKWSDPMPKCKKCGVQVKKVFRAVPFMFK